MTEIGHEASEQNRARRSCGRRRIMRLLVTAAIAAAIAMGVAGLASENAPSAPRSATAEAIRRAVATVAKSPGQIVHVALSATEVRGTGVRNSWFDDAWIGYPFGLGPGVGVGGEPEGFRQFVRFGNGAGVQTGNFGRLLYTHGNDYRSPGDELYDPRADTIYKLRAELQPPPFDHLKAPRPTGCRNTFVGGYLAGLPAALTGGSRASDRRSLADEIASGAYLGGPSPRPFISRFNAVVPDIWSPCVPAELAIQLGHGLAKRVGSTSIGARPVVEYRAANGSWTYYADARSHKPVRLIVRGSFGSEWPTTPPAKAERATLTINVRTYDVLPFAGNQQLLSLTAQHPGVKIDTKPADYYAAQARLFPRRRWG